jgi:hypothetical protein
VVFIKGAREKQTGPTRPVSSWSKLMLSASLACFSEEKRKTSCFCASNPQGVRCSNFSFLDNGEHRSSLPISLRTAGGFAAAVKEEVTRGPVFCAVNTHQRPMAAAGSRDRVAGQGPPGGPPGLQSPGHVKTVPAAKSGARQPVRHKVLHVSDLFPLMCALLLLNEQTWKWSTWSVGLLWRSVRRIREKVTISD